MPSCGTFFSNKVSHPLVEIDGYTFDEVKNTAFDDSIYPDELDEIVETRAGIE
ncbi:MAG: hypothetical protein JRI26_04255 [Deltaproteobacteria bacterium]|nr:hypothetical protein [Deltaproteobacteria bacterium]